MAQFTKQHKKTHTILLPEMMEYHFELISAAFRCAGYKMEVLTYKNPDISKTGLEFCHNDICFPCIQITGQLISALRHNAVDKDKVAFLIPQAGGACRAPNYYYLIKNALEESGFSNVPVISLNLNGKEKNPGFQLSIRLGRALIAGALYGDLLQAAYYKKQAYEKNPGESYALYKKWESLLAKNIEQKKAISAKSIRKNTIQILKEFNAIPTIEKDIPRVGIAGELYIKSCEIGNNYLEKFLIDHKIDYYMSGFTTYCLYVADTSMHEFFQKRIRRPFAFLSKLVMHWLNGKQSLIDEELHKNGYTFFPYRNLRKKESILSFECSTADGWLVAEEICSLIEAGYTKILVTIPFGCLVSHIASKGIIRQIQKKYPNTIISPIEYDSSISPVQQENRIWMVIQN